MAIYLLDDSLKVEVYFDPVDSQYEDNICLDIEESCPADEKVFRADLVNLYLTPRQARQLGLALLKAVEESCINCEWRDEEP